MAARRGTRVRELLAVPADRSKVNVWLYTRTKLGEPYPCRCSRTRVCKIIGCSSYWCPDVGRTDVAHLPAWCCARRPGGTTLAVAGYVGDNEGSDE